MDWLEGVMKSLGDDEEREALQQEMLRGLLNAWMLYRGAHKAPRILRRLQETGEISYRDLMTLVGTASSFVYVLSGQARLGWHATDALDAWNKKLKAEQRKVRRDLRKMADELSKTQRPAHGGDFN